MLITILKSIDTVVIIASTLSSITFSFTAIGLIVIPISTATARGLSIGNKVLYEVVVQNYNGYTKQYQRDQQLIKSFDNLYRESL